MARKIIASERLPEFGFTLSDKQRRRLEAQGEFPRRVPLTARTYGYVEDELIAHAERCIARRDGQEAA